MLSHGLSFLIYWIPWFVFELYYSAGLRVSEVVKFELVMFAELDSRRSEEI